MSALNGKGCAYWVKSLPPGVMTPGGTYMSGYKFKVHVNTRQVS